MRRATKLWIPPKPNILRCADDVRRANFLPGWMPGAAGAGGGAAERVTAITHHASATVNNQQITVPVTVQAGDLLVLLDTALDVDNPSTVVPSGFTQIANSFLAGSFSVIRMISSYRLADGSEASSNLTGMSGLLASYKMLYVMRGDVPATQLTLGSVNQQGTSGNPSPQTVTAGSGVAPLVVFGAYASDGTVDPRTFSPAKDGEIAGSPYGETYLAYKIYNSSPQNVTVDMDDEGAINLLQSFYIEMA